MSAPFQPAPLKIITADERLRETRGIKGVLTGISGIGKKSAERLVLEMRDKLGKGEMAAALTAGHAPGPADAKLRDAYLALVSLGHKPADAQRMVKDVAGQIAPG